MRYLRRERRRGTILPTLAISLVALCGFIALAVDLGLIAAAKTQAQNAADVAAMVGARSIDGSPVPDLALATKNAKRAAIANHLLTDVLTDPEVVVQHGAYHYDVANEVFVPQI